MRIALMLAMAAALSGAALGEATKPMLADGGKSAYTIVIPDDAIPSEVYAANDLAKTLKEISGADLPVKKMGEGKPKQAIYLGIPYGRKASDRVTYGREEFAIRMSGPNLVIEGGRPRGVMYGVFDFLEDDLGCRWFTSKVSRIPKMSKIDLSKVKKRQEAPAFEYRESFYWDSFDPAWAAHNKQNGNSQRLTENEGGRVTYYPFVHSFSQIIGADQFAAHPEYFAMVGGSRRGGYSQLCLTNPDVLRIAKAAVRTWIAEHPEATIFSVSQNDCDGPCECDNCKKVVEKEGSQSGPILQFVNAIADDIAKDHPGKLIDTLAYWYSDIPPKITKPRPNVRIRMCPIGACEAHPYTTCEHDARFVDILKGWSKLTDNLYIWHYNTNFANYMMPFPDFVEVMSSIRMYKEQGVVGLFMQGMYQQGGGGSMAEIKSYFIAKMQWDPKVDAWAVIDDFLAGYYGKAAPTMREYIDLLHAQVANGKNHFFIYTSPNDIGYLSPVVIAQAEEMFDEMEQATAKDPDALRRVQHERMCLEYVKIARGDKTNLDAFIKRCREDGVVMISEGTSLDAWEKAVSPPK
jgi:hypothetical protein